MFCFLQVHKLEQENKILETKWQLLQKKTEPESKLKPMLQSYITSLHAQLKRVNKDKEHLDAELRDVHAKVEKQKQRSVITHFIFSLEPDSKPDISVQFHAIISTEQSLSILQVTVNIQYYFRFKCEIM